MTGSVGDGHIGVADVGHRLISSNRIEGTPVIDRYGKKIGAIHSVMIEKQSGQVAYAVLTFGGFLGLGSRAYPLPWSMLTYDREQQGYCVELRFEDIEDAPYMTLDQADRPQVSQEPAYRHWDEYL
jgi:sporulation protein YlmC with PRC-barrel domain